MYDGYGLELCVESCWAGVGFCFFVWLRLRISLVVSGLGCLWLMCLWGFRYFGWVGVWLLVCGVTGLGIVVVCIRGWETLIVCCECSRFC